MKMLWYDVASLKGHFVKKIILWVTKRTINHAASTSNKNSRETHHKEPTAAALTSERQALLKNVQKNNGTSPSPFVAICEQQKC